MTVINPKSISGITSITTPAGSDNLFTVHTNDTTERFRIDVSGHQNISGIVTAANFKTGTSNLHNTGLNVQDLDVDGHTNLDNVSIAGVTTITGGRINVDNTGNPFIGTRFNAGADGAVLFLQHSRSNTIGTKVKLNDNDQIGAVQFRAYRSDNSTITNAASIQAEVNGTPSANGVPADLIFNTGTASAVATERLRITSSGVVVVGHTAATDSGATNTSNFNIVGNIGSATGEGQLNLWKRTAPSANDVLGQINFCGDTSGDPGAVIKGECDVAWDQGGDTSDHAGRLTFWTVPDNSSVASERLRITSAGKLVASTNTSTTTAFDYAGVYFNSDNSTVAEGLFLNNIAANTGDNVSLSFSTDSGNRKKSAISHVDTGNYGRGDLVFSIDPDADSGELDIVAHEKLRITSTGYREIRNFHYGPWAFTNNTAKTTITVGDPGDNKHTTIKLILTLEDTAYRQGYWQGEYTIFASNSNGGPGVDYHLHEHWQQIGSTNWNSGTVTVAITSSGALQVTADNGHDDAAGNAWVHILDVIGDIDGTTVASITA